MPYILPVLKEQPGEVLNIGIIGAGGFAGFAAKSFLQLPGINIIAVTDIHLQAAASFARELKIKVCSDIDCLLDNHFFIMNNQSKPYWRANM